MALCRMIAVGYALRAQSGLTRVKELPTFNPSRKKRLQARNSGKEALWCPNLVLIPCNSVPPSVFSARKAVSSSRLKKFNVMSTVSCKHVVQGTQARCSNRVFQIGILYELAISLNSLAEVPLN